MKREINRGYTALSLIVALLFVSALMTRCASTGTPSGGPKDTIPPVIVNMMPDNYTTNVDTLLKRIYIEFDEFVQLKDQQKEFFTSPQMKNKPQLQIRGRGVVVTLRDTLMANTTYALNFGSTIRDNNESNPLYSMRYIFSTGDDIDSMILSGYAEDSFKADSVSGVLVMLYPADSVDMHPEYDSTIFNSTPAVIARAESNGIFLAQNLKPIPYYIYAIEDTNDNFTYDPGTDKVGFIEGAKNPLELDEFAVWLDTIRKYVVAEPQLHFRMFTDKQFKRQLLSDSNRPQQHKAVLSFGASYPQIDSIIFDSIPSDRVIVEYMTKGRDTLALWFNMPPEELPDTIRGRVVYFKHDSINQLVSTSENLRLAWRFIETKEQQKSREKEERDKKKAEENGEEWVAPVVPNPFKITMDTKGQINPEQRLVFDFNYPLTKIDTAAITLQYLSAEALALRNTMANDTTEVPRGRRQPFTFERDTQNLRRWYLSANWGAEGSESFLTIPKGAITDVAGFSNDSITQLYTPLKREEYATIVVNILADEATPSEYIIELLDGEGKRVIERKTGLSAGPIQFNYVPAGEVSMRILQDLNGNGEWDSGDMVMRRQPEKAQYIESDGERKIATKVNWEIELTVAPASLFAPESQADLARRLEAQEITRLKKLHEKMHPNEQQHQQQQQHQHQH